MKYKLVIEYDGSGFYGWQMQPDLRTVQGVLMQACIEVTEDENIELYGSGRTDAGVHAIGQVAHLSTVKDFDVEDLGFQINNILPPDVSIVGVEIVDDDFHARHDAIARSYIYRISQRGNAEDPKYIWYVRERLDMKKMQQAATALLGLHDFASFTDENSDQKSSKVEMLDIQVGRNGDLIEIRFLASHFLWKMVRRLTGILVEVGKGNLEREDIADMLKRKSRYPSKFTAPPQGLFLERVFYPGEEEEVSL